MTEESKSNYRIVLNAIPCYPLFASRGDLVELTGLNPKAVMGVLYGLNKDIPLIEDDHSAFAWLSEYVKKRWMDER